MVERIEAVAPVFEAPMEHTQEMTEQPFRTEEVFSTHRAVVRHDRRYQDLLSRHTALLAIGVVLASGLLVYAVPRSSGILQSTHSEASKLTLSIQNRLHAGSQQNFSMPAHSVLVKNDIASSYIDSVEGQSVMINIGTNIVTPLPTDIANWVKSSSGPEQGTTLLSVNESNISKYVATAVQNSEKQSSTSTTGITTASESKAVNQIAQGLLKYDGVTVTIPTTSSSAQTPQ